MSKQIKVSDEVHQKLMGAKKEGETVSDLISRLLSDETPDEADKLLEQLDNKYEHPESALSPGDQALIDKLQPGELPDCCQEIYNSYPVDPKDVCKHWTKGYVNYYGRKVLGYQNTLTGGTYFEYQPLYQQ